MTLCNDGHSDIPCFWTSAHVCFHTSGCFAFHPYPLFPFFRLPALFSVILPVPLLLLFFPPRSYDLKKTTLVPAHESGLACFALNFDGTRLATCSEKVNRQEWVRKTARERVEGGKRMCMCMNFGFASSAFLFYAPLFASACFLPGQLRQNKIRRMLRKGDRRERREKKEKMVCIWFFPISTFSFSLFLLFDSCFVVLLFFFFLFWEGFASSSATFPPFLFRSASVFRFFSCLLFWASMFACFTRPLVRSYEENISFLSHSYFLSFLLVLLYFSYLVSSFFFLFSLSFSCSSFFRARWFACLTRRRVRSCKRWGEEPTMPKSSLSASTTTRNGWLSPPTRAPFTSSPSPNPLEEEREQYHLQKEARGEIRPKEVRAVCLILSQLRSVCLTCDWLYSWYFLLCVFSW